MASLWCVSAAPSIISLAPPVRNPNCGVSLSRTSSVLSVSTWVCAARGRRRDLSVCMRTSRGEEEEEERRHRNPLDFPYEWERPKPPRRPNLFPKFPALTTPLPDWLPFDEAPDDELDEDELDELEQEPDQ